MASAQADLESVLESISGIDFTGDEQGRLALLKTARKLVSKLETNLDRMYDISFQEPAVFASLQVFLDLGIWDAWAAAGGGVKSVEQLSKSANHVCEPNLVRRMLRLLAATNIVEETGVDQYKTTPLSLAFGIKDSDMASYIQTRTHHWQPASTNFPQFLAKTGYKEPLDNCKTSYRDGTPEKLIFWDRCVANPAYQESFSTFMKAWTKSKIPWPAFYDTEALIQGADLGDGGALCVDIGGLHGTDLTRLLDKHPDLPPGALVLEDLPEVVASANANEKIKIVGHDMFKPQPIKESRAYFFHAVFHDWSDDTSLRVLQQVTAAMRKGYSRVLIVDIVVPSTGASAVQASMDVEMMIALSAYERTEAMWTKLLTDAGLKIIKIWGDGRGYESLIEAELV